MSEQKLTVASGAIITWKGKILLGKKEEDGGAMSGQWHFPGGYMEEGENPEEAAEREIEEETGLEPEVHRIVEVDHSADIEAGRDDLIRVLYHAVTEKKEAEAMDDLERVEWVEPDEVVQKLGEIDSQYVERSERITAFLENLKSLSGEFGNSK